MHYTESAAENAKKRRNLYKHAVKKTTMKPLKKNHLLRYKALQF
jgi:hypothetical protein